MSAAHLLDGVIAALCDRGDLKEALNSLPADVCTDEFINSLWSRVAAEMVRRLSCDEDLSCRLVGVVSLHFGKELLEAVDGGL